MNRPERVADDTAALMRSIGEAAKAASRRLAIATADEKNAALIAAAKALRARDAGDSWRQRERHRGSKGRRPPGCLRRPPDAR